MAFAKRIWYPRIEGDLACIPLTKGLEAVIDLVDLPLVRNYAWQAEVNRNTWYAVTTVCNVDGSKTKLSMHRLVLGLEIGDPGPDHINHDGWDNRRANLRSATPEQNQQNQRPRQGGTSQYKGVSRYRGVGKWHAQIWYDGKQHHLGYFDDEKEAALAYDAAARERFGEFAVLNFPRVPK